MSSAHDTWPLGDDRRVDNLCTWAMCEVLADCQPRGTFGADTSPHTEGLLTASLGLPGGDDVRRGIALALRHRQAMRLRAMQGRLAAIRERVPA